MLSLYIHIPFCIHKCKYCSFFVVPENDDTLKEGGIEKRKEEYVQSLLQEIKNTSSQTPSEQIRTIYFGGGTPFQIGPDNLIVIIDAILESWDCEYLEELSIELNPDPFDEVLKFVALVQKRYNNIFRLRFSFGIQTFDDKILQKSGRNYLFNNLIHWLRELMEIKGSTAVYNLDFIAFGSSPDDVKDTTEQNRLPWSSIQREYFQKMVASNAFDGFSIYTLELFPGSEWFNMLRHHAKNASILSDKDSIFKEFQRLSNTVLQAGYHRYEISNFSLSGKRSIHNMVYWNFEPYLGLGINSSGLICESDVWSRTKNTNKRHEYLSGIEATKKTILSDKEVLVEKFMLLLRTDSWIDVEIYRSVLHKEFETHIEQAVEHGFIEMNDAGHIRITSSGMNIYNTVLLDLLADI